MAGIAEVVLPDSMRAMDCEEFGGPEVLRERRVGLPELRANDLLVRVAAIGVNRADILQRQGKYGRQASFGDSPLPGLELAGTVVAQGPAVADRRLGRRVMGIVGGGAYAEYARIDAGMAVAIPDTLDDVAAGASMEAYVTAHQALLHLGRLAAGERVLIHGAGGGVGSALVQLAVRAGAATIATTSSGAKCERLRALGAQLAVDYRQEDFADAIAARAPGGAIDLIVDTQGGPYLERNVRSLAPGGRLIQIGTQGGGSGTLPVELLLQRRLRIEGTVMKSVTLDEKRAMTERFRQRWWDDLRAGTLRPVVDTTFPLAEAGQAHQFLEEARNFGKIVLLP